MKPLCYGWYFQGIFLSWFWLIKIYQTCSNLKESQLKETRVSGISIGSKKTSFVNAQINFEFATRRVKKEKEKIGPCLYGITSNISFIIVIYLLTCLFGKKWLVYTTLTSDSKTTVYMVSFFDTDFEKREDSIQSWSILEDGLVPHVIEIWLSNSWTWSKVWCKILSCPKVRHWKRKI